MCNKSPTGYHFRENSHENELLNEIKQISLFICLVRTELLLGKYRNYKEMFINSCHSIAPLS